jgi:hypothetical protein
MVSGGAETVRGRKVSRRATAHSSLRPGSGYDSEISQHWRTGWGLVQRGRGEKVGTGMDGLVVFSGGWPGNVMGVRWERIEAVGVVDSEAE